MRRICFNCEKIVPMINNEPAPFCKGCEGFHGLDNNGNVIMLMELFDKKYTYSKIHSAEFCPETQIGLMETYGDDLLEVNRINNENPRRVWSCVDSEIDSIGEIVFKAGMQDGFVIYHVITDEEWQSEEEAYHLVY